VSERGAPGRWGRARCLRRCEAAPKLRASIARLAAASAALRPFGVGIPPRRRRLGCGRRARGFCGASAAVIGIAAFDARSGARRVVIAVASGPFSHAAIGRGARLTPWFRARWSRRIRFGHTRGLARIAFRSPIPFHALAQSRIVGAVAALATIRGGPGFIVVPARVAPFARTLFAPIGSIRVSRTHGLRRSRRPIECPSWSRSVAPLTALLGPAAGRSRLLSAASGSRLITEPAT